MTSAIAVIATIAVEALSMSVNLAASAVSTTSAPAGSVSFDPCAMYGQIGWFVRLSLFIWLGTFLTLVVQGFRNRPVSRLVALVNLAALIAPVRHQSWSFTSCLNTVGQIASLTWIVVVVAMALHHLSARRHRMRLCTRRNYSNPPTALMSQYMTAKSRAKSAGKRHHTLRKMPRALLVGQITGMRITSFLGR